MTTPWRFSSTGSDDIQSIGMSALKGFYGEISWRPSAAGASGAVYLYQGAFNNAYLLRADFASSASDLMQKIVIIERTFAEPIPIPNLIYALCTGSGSFVLSGSIVFQHD